MSNKPTLLLAAMAGAVVILGGLVVGLLALPLFFNRQTPPPPTETAVVIVTLPALSETPEPTASPSETPTTDPTAAPTATITNTPTPTTVPIPCDWAEFVMDVTVKDSALVAPGVSFIKTWRIRNIGSCSWNGDYDIAFSSGNAMEAPVSVALPGAVQPGETVDISVPMKAPEKEGLYTGYWQLRNPAGTRFGLGATQSDAFWVRINVELPCYWASFVADVTVPDDTALTPGAVFIKTWRLKNIGDCDWTTGFEVFNSSGDRMDGAAFDIPERVKPGETIDLSVTLEAPNNPGDYRGFWLIEASDGSRFGLGEFQTSPFWVDIKVLNSTKDYVYDFAANYCAATWKSGLGLLPCPGKEKVNGSFVIRLENPALENQHENEPALWTAPDADPDGYISGKFPAIVIRDGDHFKAWVGCLDGADECQVTFYLQYQVAGGQVMTLGVWDEIYDGQVTKIDIDLSSLAGKTVSFILAAEVDGGDPTEAEAFWFSPRIE